MHEMVSFLSVVNGHSGIKDIRPIRYGYRKKETESVNLAEQVKRIEEKFDQATLNPDEPKVITE